MLEDQKLGVFNEILIEMDFILEFDSGFYFSWH